MLKFVMAGLFYAVAFAAIWSAVSIAPDMKWPETDVEYTAAALLVSGMCSKLIGHAVLLFKLV